MKQRRKAIKSEWVEESKSNPGYHKYKFTIRELDGSEHVMPAYGKDMEDALERLVWIERADKKSFNIVAVSTLLTVIIVPSIITAITENQVWVVGSLGLAIVYGIVMVRVDKYFNKK